MGGALSPDFRAVFRATPGLYLLLTTKFEIIEATESWLRHTGTRRADVLGRTVFDVLAENPDEPAASGPRELRESLERVIRLGQPDAMPVRRYDIRRPDGGFDERYWTLLNAPFRDEAGRLAGILHRVRDVTELVRLRREGTERDELARDQQLLIERLRTANEELARRDRSLSESGRLYAIALEAGRMGSWELSLPDRRMISSARHKSYYGRHPEDRFTHDELRAAIHPDDLALRQAALDQSYQEGADYDVEYRVIWPDGSIHWIQVRGQVIRRWPDGTPEHMAGVTLDVTERKRAEEMLEARVAARTSELAEANARLTAAIAERDKAERALVEARRLEAIGRLTGGVAHDFNNLLAAVIGNLELLSAALGEAPPRRYVEAALSAAWRGGRLTQQLLAFARQQRLEAAAVDVNGLIAGMDTLLQHTLGGLVQVEMALTPALWHASTDATQLELVLLNLAINARDAMPEGGTLRLATRNVERDDTTLPEELEPGEYVLISVTDTGTGMPPEVAERALEPFFTTKEVGKGSGLGLAQAYGIARQSGGTARLRSRLGVGTIVELFLPRATAAAQAEPSDRQVPYRAGSRRPAVLVLNDEPILHGIASELLVDAGYQVQEASSVHEALAILRERRFAAAVVNSAMPGMSGSEFARLARQLQPELQVLFITGGAEAPGPDRLGPGERILSMPYGRAKLLRALGRLATAWAE
jgi:PAS domain S-box-containing protein